MMFQIYLMSIRNVPSRSDQKTFKILFIYSIDTVAPIFLGHDFFNRRPKFKVNYRLQSQADSTRTGESNVAVHLTLIGYKIGSANKVWPFIVPISLTSKANP